MRLRHRRQRAATLPAFYKSMWLWMPTAFERHPMAIAIVPVLMIVVGILVFLLSDKGKEIGRGCFWAGFIGLAIAYATHMVHIG